MLDGRVEHKDSLGNRGTIGAGDVQWMTAGSGILHEEMPKLGGGRLDGFQIWVNLPRQLKMTRPRYQDVAAAKIPEVVRTDGVRVRVVAGEVEGSGAGTRVLGAVKEIFAGPTYLDVSLPPHTSFEQPIPRGHTGLLYCFRGELSVGGRSAAEGRKVASPRLAILSDGALVRAHAGEVPARFLLLSAQPLREPYARWGPFVMNTEQEVLEAIHELQTSRFIRA
jgi:redox-sensitive bicupin YhaK (pirin superfamily)